VKKCILINKSGRKDLGQIEPLIQSLMHFAKQRMGFSESPKLELHSDMENSKNVLGKTAHYDPTNKTVAIYVDARHPKDILRSIAHELVHHTQNLRGDFAKIGDTGPGYAQKDPHLRGMEEEAYKTGNMCFRDWEDEHKRLQNESKRKNTTMSNLKEQLKRAIKKKLQEGRDETEEIRAGLQPAADWHAEPTGEAEDEGDEDTLSKEDIKPNPHGPESKEKHKPSKGMHEMKKLEEAVRNAISSFLEENQTYEINEEELEEGGDVIANRDLEETKYKKDDEDIEESKVSLGDVLSKGHTGKYASIAKGIGAGSTTAQQAAKEVHNVARDKRKELQQGESGMNKNESTNEEKELKEWYGDQLFDSLKRQWAK